jgi:hypothetical protein
MRLLLVPPRWSPPMFRRLATLAAVSCALTLFVFAACGSPSGQTTCGPDTCDGCCDASGKCRTGDQDQVCGNAGLNCDVCSGGQVCRARACVLPPPVDAGPEADGGAQDAGTDAGSADAGVDAGVDAGAQPCSATPVECSDVAISSLDLKVAPSPDSIGNVAEGTGWLSTVDSRGGGFNPTQSYVYARFGAAGLEKVALGDQAAIDSLDWDIAFRRFVIRLNGGDSGPSCTAAAVLPPGTSYDGLSTVPSGLQYAPDNFLDRPPTCSFIDDGSGLGTSPNTALAAYYEYTSCVVMTGRVFIVKTRDGRHVKLTVTTYYATTAGQGSCDSTGMTGGAPGGTIRLRWQYLD